MRPASVSVVIPLFNKEPHILRALGSVMGQTVQPLEIVVVDDGSTDGGAGVVRRVGDGRIRLVHQANAGVSCARNRGIAEARGELIAFLDADDSWNPGFLKVVLDLAARHPAAGAFGTAFEIIEPAGSRTVSRALTLRLSGEADALIEDYFRDALSGFVIWSSAVAVLKRTFDDVGLFPPGVRLGEDLDMWTRIGARYPVAVSAYVGAAYHKEAVNRADDGRAKGFHYEHVKTGLRLLESGQVAERRARHLREYVSMYQIITASQLVLLGRRREARALLLRCATRKFLLMKMWWLAWTLVPTRLALEAQKVKRTLVLRRRSPVLSRP